MANKTYSRKQLLSLKGSAISIMCFVGMIVFQSLKSALNVPTFHLDGAFQTASVLFRLKAGQAPGRDFFPYLGVGPTLLIFPFFQIAGSTLSASVFASKFVTLAVNWVAMAVLWQLILRPQRIFFSFLGGAVIFLGTDFMAQNLTFFKFLSFGFTPGHSLRPIRAAIPYILSLFTYILLRNFRGGPTRDFIISLLLSLCLLWSNDFALPTFSLFLTFYISFSCCTEYPRWRKSALTISITSLFSWLVLICFITSNHSLELLSYNFIDVATDQWWFFGPYGTNARIFNLLQLNKLVSGVIYLPLLVLLLNMYLGAKLKSFEHTLVSLIGLTLFAGGSLASIGGHFDGYFAAFIYWGVITAILMLLRVFYLILAKLPFSGVRNFILSQELLIYLSLIVSLLGTNISFIQYKEDKLKFSKDHAMYFIPELGGYLGKEWREYINYAKKHKHNYVIEDYWGIWSSINRTFPKWPIDSVIHALGNVREEAKTSLTKLELIITTRYRTSPEWQPWSLSQNFWFYEDLLINWEPAFISPTTIVWKKINQPRQNSKIVCQISSEQDNFYIAADHTGFYKVTLSYESSGSGRYLLMVRNNISFGSDANGYVSLPPKGSQQTFPVLITQDSGKFFDLKVIGNRKVTSKINSCYAEEITYTYDELLHIESQDESMSINNRSQ